MRKYDGEEWIGKRYSHLVIEKYLGKPGFLVKCDCGAERVYKATILISGKCKTCGHCQYHDELVIKPMMEGKSKKRLYRVWNSMKGRCFYPKGDHYQYYGGRGITICDEWANNYDAFEKWAYANGYDENAPFQQCTIDRIDVNGNYCPENCRWVDVKVQNANKRKPTPKYVINGERKTMKQICEEAGFTQEAVRYRMRVKGMTLEEAISVPKSQGVSLKVAE